MNELNEFINAWLNAMKHHKFKLSSGEEIVIYSAYPYMGGDVNVSDACALATECGKCFYSEKIDNDTFPYRSYFYMDDVRFSSLLTLGEAQKYGID